MSDIDYAKLLEISTRILINYNRLRDKENHRLKNDSEYIYYINVIKNLEEEEDKLYKKIYKQFKSSSEITNYAVNFIKTYIVHLLSISNLNYNDLLINPQTIIFENKLSDSSLIILRIIYKLSKISMDFIHDEELKKETDDKIRKSKDYSYDLSKCFDQDVSVKYLDILDKHIEEAENFNSIRKIYINAKYAYAFVKKREKAKYGDIDNNSITYSVLALNKIVEYINKFIKLNYNTLTSKSFERTLLLEADYIRSLLLELDDDAYQSLIQAFPDINDLLGVDYGYMVIKNILLFRDDDREKYDGLELKREI